MESFIFLVAETRIKLLPCQKYVIIIIQELFLFLLCLIEFLENLEIKQDSYKGKKEVVILQLRCHQGYLY